MPTADEQGLLSALAAGDGCPAENIPEGQSLGCFLGPLSLNHCLVSLIGLVCNPLLFLEEHRELFSAIAFMAQGQSFQSGVGEANPLLLQEAEDNLLKIKC